MYCSRFCPVVAAAFEARTRPDPAPNREKSVIVMEKVYLPCFPAPKRQEEKNQLYPRNCTIRNPET